MHQQLRSNLCVKNALSDLEPLLKFVRKNSAFYVQREIKCDDLLAFPIIDRVVLRTQIQDFLTMSGPEKPTLLRALEGQSVPATRDTASEFRFSERIVVEQTSGTSGFPLRLPKTNAERTQISMSTWRYRLSYDHAITARTFLPLFHRTDDQPLPCDPFVSSANAITTFYSWLGRSQVRWIHAPPGLISYHAEVLRNLGQLKPVPSLRFVETSGAKLDEAAATLISDVFGARVVNQYGTRETWAIAYGNGASPLELNSENVHVELLDSRNVPIDDPEVEGSVVITSKILKLLPIIRYRTGDRGRWVLFATATGGEARRLVLSDDRDINILRINGIRMSGNTLFKELLHHIDHRIGYGYARFIQIRKQSEFVFNLIVSPPGQSAPLYSELQRYLRNQDSRFTLRLTEISREESEQVAMRKPYLFVNERPDIS